MFGRAAHNFCDNIGMPDLLSRRQFLRLVPAGVIASSAGLSACTPTQPATEPDLNGTLLIWHTYPPEEAPLLNDLLTRFTSLNPGIKIVSEFVSDDDITFDEAAGKTGRLVTLSRAGLGPDLVIGLEEYHIRELLPANIIRPLDDADLELSGLYPHMVAALRNNGQLYAVPFAAYSQVLFFNQKRVANPVATAEGMLTQATTGEHAAAVPLDVRYSFWGITGFGGPFQDKTGALSVDPVGLAYWFNWLKRADVEPNILVDVDYDTLLNLFLTNDVDYFIGTSFELPYLNKGLGEESLGVAVVPMGKFTSQPIMNIETIFLNQNTAREELCLTLANFLINDAQQRRVAMGTIGRMPVNMLLDIDDRVSAIASAMSKQSQAGYIFPISATGTGTLLRDATAVSREAVEGLLTDEGAADKLLAVFKKYGLER